MCAGFGEGTVGLDPTFCVHYCVELLFWFPSWLILWCVWSVSLELCLDGLSCVRFAVVHPSVHSNDPDAERALQRNTENKPAQTARGSWPSGGDAQEMDMDTAGRGLTGPYWQLVGPRGIVQSTPRVPWCDQCLA